MPLPKPKKREDKSESGVLNAIYSTPWAITREMLETIHEVVSTHIRPDKAEITAIREKLSLSKDLIQDVQSLEGAYDKSVYIKDSVAVIPIVGPISKRMSLFSFISGGVSTEVIAHDFKLALKDEDVEAILFDIDSPGGTVDGTKMLSDLIYDSRGQKPIYAFADGQMCSGAYWIGSAVDKVIAEETATVGSIGVVMMHTEASKAAEMRGIKHTIFTAGKYKAVGNSVEPLTKEGKDYIQSRLNTFYSIFVEAVSRNRGVKVETVLGEMAEGRLFIGKQALDTGLIDELGSFAKAFDITRNSTKGGEKTEVNVSNNTQQFKGGDYHMKLKDLKVKDPDGYAALMEEALNNVKAELMDSFMKEKAEMKAEHKKIVEGLQSQISEKDTQLAAQEARLVKLEKREAIRSETEIQDRAERIFDTKLKDSDIPERLYPKVRTQVPYSRFVLEDGVLDTQAFSDAVDAEIEDWPVSTNGAVIGGAHVNREIDHEAKKKAKAEAEEDSLVDTMVGLAGGSDSVDLS